MSFEFEVLVGHLYIVGGRTISMPPPGALVEVAPQKAARGRELETFIGMVLPSRDVTAPTAFYDQMAHRAAEEYFKNTGSVTSALREVFSVLNQNLVEHNRTSKRPYEASLLCGVLRGSDLIVARVGSGVAVMRQTGETRSFPENLSDDEALFAPPLGVHPVVDVKMTRFTVTNGARLVFGDSGLSELTLDRMMTALVAREITAVLTAFREMAPRQMMMMALEFVPPDLPAPLPVREGESTSELKTKTTTSEVAAVPAARRSERAPILNRASSKVQRQAQRGAGAAAGGLARGISFLNRLLDRFFPPPDEKARRWLSTPIATGVVILIPAVVVVVVIVMWVGQTGQSELELCIREATSRSEVARNIPQTNVTDTLRAWSLVMDAVVDCEELRPNDVLMADLKAEAQEIIDRLRQIDRRATQLVATVPTTAQSPAQLRRIVLQGSDLYVHDDGNDQVYRIGLSADGRQAATGAQPIPSMRRGANLEGFVLGDLIDIAFDQNDNKIVAVDRSGVVVTCSPSFITSCAPERLLGAENWGNPVAITVWQRRLYLLDPGANQLWRYDWSGGSYAGGAPREYFQGQNRPPLINAVDFGIDDNGHVYVLRADGIVAHYFQGQAVDFGWGGFPENPSSATALYLSRSPIFTGLFVADRLSRTIYEATLGGSHSASYRVVDESQFALLGGVAADASQRLVYATSGNSVFVFQQ